MTHCSEVMLQERELLQNDMIPCNPLGAIFIQIRSFIKLCCCEA